MLSAQKWLLSSQQFTENNGVHVQEQPDKLELYSREGVLLSYCLLIVSFLRCVQTRLSHQNECRW